MFSAAPLPCKFFRKFPTSCMSISVLIPSFMDATKRKTSEDPLIDDAFRRQQAVADKALFPKYLGKRSAGFLILRER